MPTTMYRNMQKSLPNKRTTRIVIKALKAAAAGVTSCERIDSLPLGVRLGCAGIFLRSFYVVISAVSNQSINCTKVWLNLMTRRDHYRHWLTAHF